MGKNNTEWDDDWDDDIYDTMNMENDTCEGCGEYEHQCICPDLLHEDV